MPTRANLGMQARMRTLSILVMGSLVLTTGCPSSERLPEECTAGDVLRRNAANTAWECVSPSALQGVTAPAGSGLTAAASGSGTAIAMKTCPAGQILKQTSTGWDCAADENAGGTITAVTAGPGLTGGAASGAATLAVDFGGDGGELGTAAVAARTDHVHDSRYINSDGTTVEPGAIWVQGNIRTQGFIRAGGIVDGGIQLPPADMPGLIFRRINSTLRASGTPVLRSAELELRRDGSPGGLVALITAPLLQNQSIDCLGLDASGTVLGRRRAFAAGSPVGGSQQLYADTENIVFLTCSMGNPFANSHTTEFTLHREAGDPYWVGYVISTINQ